MATESLILSSLWRVRTLFSSTMAHNFGCSSRVSRSSPISQEDENMGQPLNSEIERFLQSLNDVDHGGETDQDEMETVDVYFVRREAEIEPQDAIVDATPAQPTCGPSALFTSATIFFCVGILFSAIALQLYLAVNPPVATITIVPDTKTVTLNGTLPLGRLT